MSTKWTAAMDAELTRRRKDGEGFARIAVAMKLPKNTAIARAKRLGLDPTDWTTSERFYALKPIKHTPRRTYAQKRLQGAAAVENAIARAEAEPPPEPPFRSPIQDEWPLTMCAELPLSIERDYERVNR